jgi:hypothetical protein
LKYSTPFAKVKRKEKETNMTVESRRQNKRNGVNEEPLVSKFSFARQNADLVGHSYAFLALLFVLY